MKKACFERYFYVIFSVRKKALVIMTLILRQFDNQEDCKKIVKQNC